MLQESRRAKGMDVKLHQGSEVFSHHAKGYDFSTSLSVR